MGSLTLLDLADIALVATGILVIFVWLRKAHAGLAALGCMLLVAVYLVARELRLEMTAWMFQGFSAVFLIILIVVLQNDLRRSFERLTRWGFRGGERSGPPTIRTVSEAAFDLARRDWGAIFVLTGRDLIDHHVEGGQELTGIPSTPLFISLFDPNSPGHDGAVIIDGDRVSRFGVHLPLSNDFREIESRGTRHSAALGLSELTDAAAVIVSEERGEVTLAQKGRLRSVATAEELEELLRPHTSATPGPRDRTRTGLVTLRKHLPEAASALLISAGLWWVFSSGSELPERTFRVPVQVENVDAGYVVGRVDPPEVDIVLEAEARDLFLLDPTRLRIRLDASGVRAGERKFILTDEDVVHPEGFRVGLIEPAGINLEIIEAEEENEGDVPPAPPAS